MWCGGGGRPTGLARQAGHIRHDTEVVTGECLQEQVFQFQQKQPQMHNTACSRRSGDKLPIPSSEWGLHVREQVCRMLSWARHPGGPLRLRFTDVASERDITLRQTLGGNWSVKTPFSSECLHPCTGALYPVSLRSVLQKMLF